MLPSSELEPAGDVDALESLPEADGGTLDAVAVIKLNGGLATTMGLRSPKSLVEARDGRSFLDIIIGNTLALRERYGVRLPLVLMNSQATREDTAAALDAHPDLDTGLPVVVHAEHGAEARRRVTRTGELASRAVTGIVPARTR